jgi:glutamate-1-semialdehyde 2,1-aminomutase
MKRGKIAKMDGGYHGWHDAVMFNAGGVTATSFGGWKPGETRSGLGIPEVLGSEIVILPFNDIDGCERVIREHRHDLAAVIAEPFLTSAIIPPREGFLKELREITKRYDILLIFDEISSFGLGSGGGQGYYDIAPDLTCVGKVIGGGMPIGAVGGRADIMDLLNAQTPPFIFASGTFSFHPLAMVAGAAYLEQLTPELFTELHRKGDAFRSSLRAMFERIEAPMSVTGVGHFYALHCQAEEPENWTSFTKGDRAMWSLVAMGLKNRGFWVGDGRGTLTMVNDDSHIADFIAALEESVSDAYVALGNVAI